MNDKENVIKGLEQFKADFKPFCGNGSDWERVDDAIALLKEQEDLGAELTNAVELIHKKNKRINELLKDYEPKPIAYTDNPYTGLSVAHCPKCGKFARQFHSSVEEETHYCPWCGQEVKWE